MIIYYTDGSASPNPGPGGYAVIMVEKSPDGTENMRPVALGSEPSGAITTNIRMEGLALMAALSHAGGKPCIIYTDSEFWINVITMWSVSWEANGWKKKNGPIMNLDIVQKVCPLYKASQAKLQWVRGHANDPGNEMADHWANEARKGVRLSDTNELMVS